MDGCYRLDFKELGQRIRQARKSKGHTQSELAEKVHLSQNMIGKLETNKATASMQTIINIANALEADINFFLSDSQPEGKSNTDLFIDSLLQDLTDKEKQIVIHFISALKAHR